MRRDRKRGGRESQIGTDREGGSIFEGEEEKKKSTAERTEEYRLRLSR